MSAAVRILAAVTVLNGLAGLGLQFYVILMGAWRLGYHADAAAWRYGGYFTVLTNILLVLIAGRAIWRPADRRGLNAPWFETMVCVSMLLVGAVYVFYLRALWHFSGVERLVDWPLHYLGPLLAFTLWVIRPHGALRWRDAVLCLAWPAIYAVYALARGAVDHWYAYPFLDVTTIGYLGVARSALVLGAAVLIAGLLLVELDKVIAEPDQ